MATLQQVIQLVFEGVDNASEVAKDVSSSLNSLSLTVEDIAEPFAQLAKTIELTSGAAAGMAGVIGVVAVRAAADFSSALSDLDRFLQSGEGDARDYRDTFQSLAVEYGVSANDIIRATADWSAANFKIRDSLDLTTLSLRYATAGQLEAGQATELLKQLMSGLNLEQENSISSLTRWGDVVNFIADASKSDFQELAIAISGLAPSFNTSGASVEQFAAIINSSVELFQSGSKAADGLRTIIGQITTPTDAAAASLAEFGIAVDGAGVVQGTFFDVMNRIAEKWPSLTAEQQRNAAATIVSAERADQFKNILDAWPTSMRLAESAIVGSTGSISREVERALQTTEVAFNRFGQSLNNLLIAIGEQLEPVTVDVTNALRDLAQAFQRLVDSGALQPLFDILNRQGGELAVLFRNIAKNLPEAFAQVDLSPIATAFERLGSAFEELLGALFGEIDLSTVEGLASALQLIVNIGASFITTLEGIVRGLAPLAEGLRSAATGFDSLDRVRQLEFGQFLAAMQTITIVGPKVAAALLLISQTALDMQSFVNAGIGAVIITVNAFQVAFDGVAWVVVQAARGIATAALAIAELDAYMNRNADNSEEYRQRVSRLNGALDSLNLLSGGIAENFNRNSQELREGWSRAVEGANEKTEELKTGLTETEDRIKSFGKSTEDAGTALRESVKDYDGILAKLNQIDPVANQAGVALSELKTVAENALIIEGEFSFSDQPIKDLKKTWDENGNPVFEAIGSASIKATGAFATVGNAAKDQTDKIDEATKKSQEWQLKMEEIASNERIKLIEASVELNVARLETDAERVKSVFASIDATISSTGDLLGSLFGSLTESKDFIEKSYIRDQIEIENKRRQEALDIQKRLAEAEIERIQAQTAALERGDAIIRIDGSGLAPQLEAFMWEILKAIRVRVNAEFADYLLGVT